MQTKLHTNYSSTEKPNKPKRPVPPQSREGMGSVVYPFNEEGYNKGIAALKNGNAAGLYDVLVE